MLGARAARERAMGMPLIDDDPIDVPERSGARRIRRPDASLDDGARERWRFAAGDADASQAPGATATALFACGLSLALLTLLAALGILLPRLLSHLWIFFFIYSSLSFPSNSFSTNKIFNDSFSFSSFLIRLSLSLLLRCSRPSSP
jgi:hypothetical protein